ncbi:hypothetical protein H1D32_12170 [Anaerobacillus sp. CMMVII]|uniref:hypothetical protein n=1 Tax=Anaerobacillus sp. CMMVII TaxID=2755588 RepID=UPI0021B723CB|nr:hypothetical protein [Anaerobacillus sp. CMMVII]MCT8138433.1 hypothetical protein [Anaerobacillus sp. CMMVII]
MISILLAIIIIIVGIILNFSEFSMGSPATMKNLIVTFVYFAIWVLVITIGAKSKSRGTMRYYSVFWLITLFFSIITGYVNVAEVNVDWAIPFVILFLTQWYGINFFVESFLTSSIIIAFISLIMFITTIVSLKKV